MTTPPTLPWTLLLSNLIWIIGCAIVLATWSYQEGLARIENTRIRFIFLREKLGPIYGLGISVTCAGIVFSVHILWIKILFTVSALMIVSTVVSRARWYSRVRKSMKKEAKPRSDAKIFQGGIDMNSDNIKFFSGIAFASSHFS